MLLPWLTFFDFRGAFANFIETKRLDYQNKCEDFVILVPIFNDVKYLTNIEFLRKYSGRVALCTTNIETDEFYEKLYKIADENGFMVIECDFDKGMKNPWKIYHKTLVAHEYVLGRSLKALKAKYVIFLDGDTTCKNELSYLAGIMERDNIDLASVKIVPSKHETVAENLQYIEYEIAMKSRRIYPWLTSGAAMIGKRDSMEKIMEKHSLFFNGGDIEIGKIAYLMGFKVEYIPVNFYTDVPETIPKLVKQRTSWFCGAFRHSVINAHTNLFSPLYSLYFTIIIFFMLPFKIYEMLSFWYVLPFIIVFYMIMTIVSNWKIRNRYMLISPLYSLLQVIIMPILGMFKYFETIIRTGNVGFIKVFYKNNYPPLRYVFNILLIGVIIFAIFNIDVVEEKLLLHNIDIFGILELDFHSKSVLSIIYNGIKLFLVMTGTFFFFMILFRTFYYVRDSITNKKVKLDYRKIFKIWM